MIRRANTSDVPAIRNVALHTWPHTFAAILSPEQIQYMLDWMYNETVLTQTILAPNHAFWLFEEAGEVLGFAGIEHGYETADTTKLHKIYVLPSAQGKQVGQQLLNRVIDEARSAGSTQLLLNVNKYNKATAFYARFGFTIVREEVIAIGNGYVMDDYIMACPV